MEKLEIVQHQPTVKVIPQFLPIPQNSSVSNEAQPSVRFDQSDQFDESRVVPAPIDEPGVGETHRSEEARGSVEPGMDIDKIEEMSTQICRIHGFL